MSNCTKCRRGANCPAQQNITLQKRLTSLIGKQFDIVLTNRKVFTGTVKKAGQTFFIFFGRPAGTNKPFKNIIVKFSNLARISLGEVGSDFKPNTFAIIRTRTEGIALALFLRIGKDFIEFIQVIPDNEPPVTLFFRQIVPCQQLKTGIECFLTRGRMMRNYKKSISK